MNLIDYKNNNYQIKNLNKILQSQNHKIKLLKNDFLVLKELIKSKKMKNNKHNMYRMKTYLIAIILFSTV